MLCGSDREREREIPNEIISRVNIISDYANEIQQANVVAHQNRPQTKPVSVYGS